MNVRGKNLESLYVYTGIEDCCMHLCMCLYIDTLYINSDFLPKDNSVSHEHYICFRLHKEKKNNSKSVIPITKSAWLLLILKYVGF